MNNKKYTVNKEDKKEQINNLLSELENGIRNFKDSESYMQYLNFVTKFHNYSFSNVLLISRQLKNASYCKGFKAWAELNRKVKKGEKAIKILAPNPYKKIVKDEETGEEKEEQHLYFKTVSVFDISQTELIEGKEDITPTVVKGLEGNTDKLDTFIKVVKSINNIEVEFKDVTGGAKGYYSPIENRIVVKKDMSEVQKAKTVIHELAHSMLHKNFNYSEARGQAETEAESIAFIVCNYFNIDTKEYSFPYINAWANDDIKVLKKSLDTIQKTALKIIEEIEKI